MQEQTEILKEMLGVLRETAATLRAGRDKVRSLMQISVTSWTV